MSLQQNLKALMERTNYKGKPISGKRLADLSGADQPTIHRILSGKVKEPRNDSLFPIARFFNISVAQLKGEVPLPELEGGENFTQAPTPKGKIPVVSWVNAGKFGAIAEPVPLSWCDDWIETTVPILEHTFALKVVGDSMEPDFPEGMVLVVEPDLEYKSGDFVIAHNGDGEASFKQLIRDGGDWYLKPLNPRYPIKPLGNNFIVGVVLEAIRKLR